MQMICHKTIVCKNIQLAEVCSQQEYRVDKNMKLAKYKVSKNEQGAAKK